MIWAGITINRTTNLYINRNSVLTDLRCRIRILRSIVAIYAAAIGVEFILMDECESISC